MGEEQKIILEIPTSDGVRSVAVRRPTDGEWIERQRHRHIITRDLGRGITETDVTGGGEFDAELINKLAGEDVGVTPEAATLFLNQLATADVIGVERDTETTGFRVDMLTCGGVRKEFLLACPSAKQMAEYQHAFVRVLNLPFNQQEIKTNLRAAESLFDVLSEDKSAPIIHKVACVSAVVSEIKRIMEPVVENP